MKTITRLILLVLFLSPIAHPFIQAGSSSEDSRISSYGEIIYDIAALRVHAYDGLSALERNDPHLLATNLDMYVTHGWQGDMVSKLHAINPNLKVLLYWDMSVIKNFHPEWETALEGGWLLRDSEGNLIHSTIWPTHYLVDIVNQEYRDLMVTLLNNYFSLWGFDGVFADNCLKVSVDQWCWDATGKPVNPRTGKLYTDEEIRDDTIFFINYVKSQIEGKKLWISNGIFNGPVFFNRYHDFLKVLTEASLDGFMSEGLFNTLDPSLGGTWYYSEDQWKKSTDFVVWIQENFLNQPEKFFLPHGRCAVDLIPPNCTSEKMASFVFSSLLLSINKSQNYFSLHGAMLLDKVQNMFKIGLGVPKGNYYVIEGTHVYARTFTKIKVLVNPTDQTYPVYLDGDYETLEGQIVSSVNIDPHSGLILKISS